MKKFIYISVMAAMAVCGLTGCTSYEIDMPSEPTPPTIGAEVTTNVIYQANPRFLGKQECLKKLGDQLPRISEMGCDILWIMPVYEPGQLKSIGSPYCIKDFKALNPAYGTIEDLKNVVSSAHAKGMKVILDWVANHTSWDHPWISEHPDRYVHDENGNIIEANGWKDVAQLDFSNKATRNAMIDAMEYWVNRVGIDGYRFDYVDGVPSDFWIEATEALLKIREDMILLAETSKDAYYADGFTMIYDWGCTSAISGAFHGGKPSEVVTEAKDALSKVPEGKSILRYAFNHDVASENDFDTLFGNIEGIPAAYVLASMLNGTPMIYSAMDAEGLSGKISFFDYRELSFSSSLTATYKAINSAFKESAELRRGELRDFSDSSTVCFTRSIPGHTLLVMVNPTAEHRSVRTPISLANSKMTSLLDGTEQMVPITVSLQPYGYAILKN